MINETPTPPQSMTPSAQSGSTSNSEPLVLDYPVKEARLWLQKCSTLKDLADQTSEVIASLSSAVECAITSMDYNGIGSICESKLTAAYENNKKSSSITDYLLSRYEDFPLAARDFVKAGLRSLSRVMNDAECAVTLLTAADGPANEGEMLKELKRLEALRRTRGQLQLGNTARFINEQLGLNGQAAIKLQPITSDAASADE